MSHTLDLFAITPEMVKAEAAKAEVDTVMPRQRLVLTALGALQEACYHEINAWLEVRGVYLEKTSLTDPIYKLRERGLVLDSTKGAPVRDCDYTRMRALKSGKDPKKIEHYRISEMGLEELHELLNGAIES